MTNAKAAWALRTIPDQVEVLLERIEASRGSYKAKLVDEYNHLVVIYNEAVKTYKPEG